MVHQVNTKHADHIAGYQTDLHSLSVIYRYFLTRSYLATRVVIVDKQFCSMKIMSPQLLLLLQQYYIGRMLQSYGTPRAAS